MSYNKPYADGAASYQGQTASIETNGGSTLPWSIVLSDGRRLCDCGSYAAAAVEFERRGLVAV